MHAANPAQQLKKPRSDPRPAVLLVDDNDDDVVLTVQALAESQIDASDVVIVRDGSEAIDYLASDGPPMPGGAERLPKLILLDINLPKLSGLTVLDSLRQSERTRYIPTVILTSSNAVRDIRESYRLGANSYIQKPIDSDEFARLIGHVTTYWLAMNLAPNA